MLKLFFLGNFSAERDGHAITRWGGRQTRELVKVLAAAAGQPLSRDALVDFLWDDPPVGAERDLKVLVSRARRALSDEAHEVIVSTASGYAFDAECWRDTREFERLIAEGASWSRAGRAALAEASYSTALELYRGPFLAENLYADWASAYRDRYHRLFVDSLLALGGLLFDRRDPGALAVGERLLAEDPYADSALRAVMLARAASGDASAALDAYARFHQRLLEDLGASPSAESERLHAAILRGEPIGDWPRVAALRPDKARRVEVSADRLIGRARERELLETALEAVAGGEAGVVVLTGEAGIGKTRLLQSLVGFAGNSFHVLQASGRDRERHLPFQLLAEAIRSLAVGRDELQRAAGPYVHALAQLAPELGAVIGEEDPKPIPPTSRRRILEGTLHLLRSLTESRPVLVVLDDLHWADPSTVDALLFCARRLTASHVLWALAVRPGEPGAIVDEVGTLPGAQLIELGPLSADDVRLLLGDLPESLVTRVATESGGVPFYVLEISRALAEEPETGDVPEGIRRAIRGRIERVGPLAHRILEAAAVLGDGFEAPAAAQLAEVPVGVGLEAIEQLMVRRLLLELDHRPGTFRFAHDLIRRSVYETLGAGRRRLLHGRAADLGLGHDQAVQGQHALLAGRLDQAAGLFRDAGDSLLAEHATREAEALYAAGLDAAQQARLGRGVLVDLLDRLGRSRSARGDYVAAAEAHRSALALAADERTAARQTVRLGWVAYYQHRPERAVELGRQAEERGDSETRGEGLLLQAKVAQATGGVELAATQVAQAAQLVGPDALPEVRALLVAIANHQGRYREAVLRFEEAAGELRRAGLLRPLASATLHAGIALSGRGDYARAIAVLEDSVVQCQQAGAEHLQARVHNTLGGIYRQLGQRTRAEEQHAHALELAMRNGFEEALAHAWVGQAEDRIDAGDLAAARGLVELATAIVHDQGVLYSWRIHMRWLLVGGRLDLLEDRRDAALARAEQVARAAVATGSPKYEVLAGCLRAEVLGPADGGPDAARSALERALRLDAPPLVWDAAMLVSRLTSGGEAEHARRLGSSTVDLLAAALPDELGRSLIAHGIARP